MRITIDDDFDLDKTANCGQCFRAKEIEDGIYRFITKASVIYIRQVEANTFDVSCNADEWTDIWEDYFDLATNYQEIRSNISKLNDYLKKAAQLGEGIRILRQEPFETLISFIISQRKSIPSIRTSVERIAAKYGKPVTTKYETVNLFPTLDEIKSALPIDLSGCGLAYRADYIKDAIDKLCKGEIKLEELWNKGDEELTEELKQIRGVGDKVANCVALFAYHRVDRVPIDVWIARAINDDFGGHNFFEDIEHNAGIAQQYVFYAKKFAKNL